MAVLAALAALVGGGIVAMTTYLGARSPDTVAVAYFRALAQGNATGALALGELPSGPRTYLTGDVLRAAQRIAKISDIRVLSVDQRGSSAKVAVQYELAYPGNPATVTDAVAMTRHGRSWRLSTVAAATMLAPESGAARLAIDGATVPTTRVLFFPGALPVSVDTSNLDIGQQVVHLSGSVPTELRPEVSATGRRAVADAVAAGLRACLGSQGTATCPTPADPRAVPGSVRGTLTGNLVDDLTVAVDAGPDGLLEVTGSVEVRGSYQQLDFNNLPTAKAGIVSLSIRAHCYATTPAKLVWETTS